MTNVERIKAIPFREAVFQPPTVTLELPDVPGDLPAGSPFIITELDATPSTIEWGVVPPPE